MFEKKKQNIVCPPPVSARQNFVAQPEPKENSSNWFRCSPTSDFVLNLFSFQNLRSFNFPFFCFTFLLIENKVMRKMCEVIETDDGQGIALAAFRFFASRSCLLKTKL
eukprot:Pompholyxophrys_punicea_v1_NODE_403_length_2052_cov_8.412412.p3 type:complete len:108 gc:universal NODE_403_length_2052_cov_8.412412:472-149(-)